MKKIDLNLLSTAFVTKEEHGKAQSDTKNLMIGVLLVMGLGFITLLIAVISPIIDAWKFRTATYQTLSDKVSQQNYEIELMKDEFKKFNSQVIYIRK